MSAIENTIAIVVTRETADSPWRLHTLYAGSAKHSQNYDCGWNSSLGADLCAMSGSGPGLPYLHGFVQQSDVLHGAWSSVGWRSEEGPVCPEDLGYMVLESMPELEILECDRIVFCETCEEEQDTDALCGHIWWCDTEGWWIGAVHEGPAHPCADDEDDCWECRTRAGLLAADHAADLAIESVARV